VANPNLTNNRDRLVTLLAAVVAGESTGAGSEVWLSTIGTVDEFPPPTGRPATSPYVSLFQNGSSYDPQPGNQREHRARFELTYYVDTGTIADYLERDINHLLSNNQTLNGNAYKIGEDGFNYEWTREIAQEQPGQTAMIRGTLTFEVFWYERTEEL